MHDIDDPRREFLIRALSAGIYVAGSGGIIRSAWAMGKVPIELPPGKSIYDIRGEVLVDNRMATLDTKITPTSTIKTGANGQLIFVVGKDAFILRENSQLVLEGGNLLVTNLRLITGKILSVFGKRTPQQRLGIKTVTATIGIRGTGIYVESDPEQSYVCTCYGLADLLANNDKQSHERVETQHHDAPRYILTNAPAGQNIQPAPVINHSDDELALIEALVGRSVPFSFTGNYSTPRKSGY